MIAFGLILTLIGAFVASRLQQRAWERQYRISIEDAQLERAQKLADTIAHTCDDRLHFQKQFYLAVRYRDRFDIKDALKNYRKALERWNKNYNYIRSNLFSLYSYNQVLLFENLIQNDFAELGSQIESRYNSSQIQGWDLDKKFQLLSVKCYQFVHRMQSSIRERNLPNFPDIYSVAFHNLDHLDSMYLIKRLYGISTEKARI